MSKCVARQICALGAAVRARSAVERYGLTISILIRTGKDRRTSHALRRCHQGCAAGVGASDCRPRRLPVRGQLLVRPQLHRPAVFYPWRYLTRRHRRQAGHHGRGRSVWRRRTGAVCRHQRSPTRLSILTPRHRRGGRTRWGLGSRRRPSMASRCSVTRTPGGREHCCWNAVRCGRNLRSRPPVGIRRS